MVRSDGSEDAKGQEARMAQKKQPAKKLGPEKSGKPVVPPAGKVDPATRERQEAASELAKANLPAIAKRMSSSGKGSKKSGAGAMPEASTKKLSKQELDAVRL